MRMPRVIGWHQFAVAVGVLSLIAIAIVGMRPESASANPATDFVSMTSGDAHTCALTSGGGVKCWGNNRNGMLGDGTTTDRTVPADVIGLTSGVTAIAAGTVHTCALTNAGGVKCWGNNIHQQLGEGTLASWSATPIDVIGLTSGVTVLGAGANHNCAATTANEVKCWGFRFGMTPTAIPNTNNVTQITASNEHTCALTGSGTVKCWGSNEVGQLGNGTTSPSTTAVDVAGISNAVALAPSAPGAARSSCALLATDEVKCWGSNLLGELGTTTFDLCGGAPCSKVPVGVPGLHPGVVGVAIGFFNVCAAVPTGVQCWGSGFGSVATDVLGFSGSIVGLTRSADHGCVWTAASQAECWGSNGNGQLGNGTNISSLTPVAVVALIAKPTATPTPCPPSGCPTPEPTPACAAQACMALAMKDAGGDILCRSDGNAECFIATGKNITLAVLTTKPPAAGYWLAQVWIDYGNVLTYVPAQAPADEVTWPDSSLSLRGFPPHAVKLGALTGFVPPLPVSHFIGEVFEFAFACTSTPSSSNVALLPSEDPVARTEGALYMDADEDYIIPNVGSLTINCVDVAPAAVGGLALDSELRGIAAQDGSTPWLWNALGLGVIAALSALAIVRQQRER